MFPKKILMLPQEKSFNINVLFIFVGGKQMIWPNLDKNGLE